MCELSSDVAVMAHVGLHLPERQVQMVSSHEISFLETPAGRVVIKRQVLPDDDPSPFWQRMRLLFGSDFAAQRRTMPEIARLVGQNPHLAVPHFFGADQAARYAVFAHLPGEGREPDEFPPGEAIAYRLGQYVGFLHTQSAPFCGLPGGRPVYDFPERLRRYVQDKGAACGALPEVCRRFLAEGLPMEDYAPIMTDISANQFLFSGGCLAACVDLDAYVYGPRAWELELIEATVADMAAFRRGYETYRPYPDMARTRGLYAFVMS